MLHFDKSKSGGTAYWICKCDCGTIKSVNGVSLRKGISTSCGCYRTENSRINNGKYIDETGNRYGKLLVLGKDEELSNKNNRAWWLCKCDCGNTTIVSSKCLRNGHTTSCGCRTMSIGEENIINILNANNIIYTSEYRENIGSTYYRYDFAIQDINNKIIRLIEFDGI